MKRFFLLTTVCSILGFSAMAQENASAPSNTEIDEKVKRLSADVETLLALSAKLQTQISAMRDEIASLHQQQAKAANDSSVQTMRDDLRKLAEKVQEVDKKRIEDREVVTEQLEKIEKVLKAGIPTSSPRNTKAPRTDTAPAAVPTGPGFEYVVKSGDTVSEIVAAANAQFKEQGLKSVTLQQVLDANPGLNPNKMKVGQKIFIPAPGK